MHPLKHTTGFLVMAMILSSFGPHATPEVFGMASRPPSFGSVAPDFQLPDLAGTTRSLREYRGTIVLLNFWATWCQPCTKEMPAMEAAQEQLKEQGLTVIAVNELEDTTHVQAHIRKHGQTFTVLLDHDNQVANMYGVVGLPVTVFIDREGIVKKFVRGGLLTPELIRDTVTQIAQQETLSSRRAS